jgi:hypothetical protein
VLGNSPDTQTLLKISRSKSRDWGGRFKENTLFLAFNDL